MMTIDEFMTTAPYTLRETDSLYQARKIMTEKHVRHIPITDESNHLLGLVTQRDILAITGYAPTLPIENEADAVDKSILLSEVMISDVSTIRQTDSLREAAMYLQSHKYGCLPVVSNGCLVGIITDSDFVGMAINLLEQIELADAEAEAEASIELETDIDEVDLA